MEESVTIKLETYLSLLSEIESLKKQVSNYEQEKKALQKVLGQRLQYVYPPKLEVEARITNSPNQMPL